MTNNTENCKWTVGIDEAGRGPLAGPVQVGVYAVPKGANLSFLNGIKDSKKLSSTQREKWFTIIRKSDCARFATVATSAKQIDTKGIVWAVQSALEKALEKLGLEPHLCEVMLDGGLTAPAEYLKQKTIIKGDTKIPVISAAAILAKVTRDKKMVRLGSMYPEYGFEIHKGYGTVKHRNAIQKFGASKEHRVSFCKNITLPKQ